MTTPTAFTTASALASEIARAARRPGAARALALDLDGTLAPITANPRDSRVPPATLKALRTLVREGWDVAIVSGRPAAHVRAMVPVSGVTVFGSHGIEHSGRSRLSLRLRTIAARSARIAGRVREWTGEFGGVVIERKPFGCAFHYRALPAVKRARFRRRLHAWLEDHDTRGLEVLQGKCVVELRPAGFSKGLAARRWPAARAPRRGDRSLVAIGDDRTDEDLFAALRRRGLTVLVGSPRRATIAHRKVSGAAAVARLLTELAETTKGGRPHARA
jgi:trehalose-phosphatase